MNGGAEVPAPRRLSNLQLRIVSAVLLAAFVLAITFLGRLPFRVLAALISAAIFYEWSRMVRPRLGTPLGYMPEAFMVVFVTAMIAGFAAPILWLLTATLLVVTALAMMLRGTSAWEPLGLAYAITSGLSLAQLRGSDHAGLLAILFLFAVVWASDILAFFVGRAVGGPKLAPGISPGKTWSGAFGGAVGGVAAGLAVGAMTASGPTVRLAFVALALSAVSQIGDLFESWVKRRNGAKDPSHLIPGHGGVMDRVDGLVAAAFALLLLGWLGGHADRPGSLLFPS